MTGRLRCVGISFLQFSLGSTMHTPLSSLPHVWIEKYAWAKGLISPSRWPVSPHLRPNTCPQLSTSLPQALISLQVITSAFIHPPRTRLMELSLSLLPPHIHSALMLDASIPTQMPQTQRLVHVPKKEQLKQDKLPTNPADVPCKY